MNDLVTRLRADDESKDCCNGLRLCESQDLMLEAADRINALEAALEHIVRECGALNKGPVAVHLALAALNPRTTAPASTSE